MNSSSVRSRSATGASACAKASSSTTTRSILRRDALVVEQHRADFAEHARRRREPARHVEARRHVGHALMRDALVRRAQAVDAVERGGDAHRAAGVAAEREIASAGAAAPPPSRPTSRRAGGPARAVHRRAVMRVGAGDAVEEFVADRLAGDGGAGVEELSAPAGSGARRACMVASQSGLPPPARSPAMAYMSLTTAERPASGPVGGALERRFEIVRDEEAAIGLRHFGFFSLRAGGEVPVEDFLAAPAGDAGLATGCPRRCARRGRCGAARRTDRDGRRSP